MARKTILFGNGLGMAVSPDTFLLENALAHVWLDNDVLTDEQRELIRACLPEDTEHDRPSSEDDLDVLQRVLASCDYLDSIEIDSVEHWLSEAGREFPSAIRRFIHQTACRFHGTEEELPEGFSEPLVDFIHETKSHIATLNYDPLLYDSFLSSRVLNGYSGDLIDGITTAGYRSDNLQRNRPDRLGWYLHLHGSPLFYDAQNGRIKKLRRGRLLDDVIETTHLVLTHVRHKTAIISASPLLTDYWRHFGKALKESEELILFGYSGYDEHLNSKVARLSNGIKLRVVEWSGAQPDINREKYWASKLKANVEVEQYDSILDFIDW